MSCCDYDKLTRRAFFGASSTGVGMAALANLLGRNANAEATAKTPHGGLPGFPNFPPTAKRVIYLFQSGGPSQMEFFDYKPRLVEFQGTDLPESIRGGQRLTGMSATRLHSRSSPRNSNSLNTATPALGSVSCFLTRRHRRSTHFHQNRQHRGNQPRSGCHHGADRLSSRRPSQHGSLDLLWHRLRDRRPPGLRRNDLLRRRWPTSL